MNVQRGLERMSAVWWGLWGVFGLAMLLSPLFTNSSDRWELSGAGFVVLVLVFVAHKLTCWIVAGFFSPRS